MTDARHLIFVGVLASLCPVQVKIGFVAVVYAQLSLHTSKLSFAKYSNPGS